MASNKTSRYPNNSQRMFHKKNSKLMSAQLRNSSHIAISYFIKLDICENMICEWAKVNLHFICSLMQQQQTHK